MMFAIRLEIGAYDLLVIVDGHQLLQWNIHQNVIP